MPPTVKAGEMSSPNVQKSPSTKNDSDKQVDKQAARSVLSKANSEGDMAGLVEGMELANIVDFEQGEDDDDDDDEEDNAEEVQKLPFRDPPLDCVRLRPSAFNNIPPTVFIEYPPELGMTRQDESEIEELGSRKLGYVM